MTDAEYLETVVNAFAYGVRQLPADWHALTDARRLSVAKDLHAELLKSDASADVAFRKQNPRLFKPAAAPAQKKLGVIMPRPTIRNLIYHVCPLKSNDGWLANVRQLQKRMGIFNGKKVIGIAHGEGLHAPEVVMRELPECEFIVLPNDPELRETVTFLPLLLSVANEDYRQATFYGHTKGNSTAENQAGAIRWRNAAYHHLLDRAPDCMMALETHAAVGINKIVWHGGPPPYPTGLQYGGWMFAGTFFWFRNDVIFSRHWRNVPPDRYGAEAWLSGPLRPEECKSMFQPWPEVQYPAPSPYDPRLYHAEFDDGPLGTSPYYPVNHRDDFPKLIDSLGLKTAVEVGVASGTFARVLLRSKLEKLYLVDPWPNPADADNRRQACQLAAEFPGRVEIIEATSVEAAKRFKPGEIGAVHIDAMHEYPAVKQDIETWWPIARRLLFGHDYAPWNTVMNCACGVIPAIEEFAEKNRLLVQVTGAPAVDRASRLLAAWRASEEQAGILEAIPSWWIVK